MKDKKFMISLLKILKKDVQNEFRKNANNIPELLDQLFKGEDSQIDEIMNKIPTNSQIKESFDNIKFFVQRALQKDLPELISDEEKANCFNTASEALKTVLGILIGNIEMIEEEINTP